MKEEKQTLLETIEQINQRSEEAFILIYEQYMPFVLRIAISILKERHEAEDICHDIFVDLIKYPEQYDPSKGSLKAFLAIKTRNKCLDRLRVQKRWLVGTGEVDAEEGRWASGDTPLQHTLDIELKEVLSKAMQELPPPQRQALLHAYYREETHQAIAQQLNKPLGSVKSLIRYGLKNMRKQLEKWHWHLPG